jgi:hypothetical protein
MQVNELEAAVKELRAELNSNANANAKAVPAGANAPADAGTVPSPPLAHPSLSLSPSLPTQPMVFAGADGAVNGGTVRLDVCAVCQYFASVHHPDHILLNAPITFS